MTSTMIIVAAGLIGLLLLAFLAFWFLKKRNQEDDGAYLPEPRATNNPKLEELLQSAEEAATPSSAPTTAPSAPSASSLDKIELLTQDQRYEEAVTELKRFLMTHPKDERALLKLLQVYGITNNRGAFHQLHSKIHEIGSPELIEQADFCRSLLEDDLVETPKAVPATNEVKVDMLEFDAPQTIEEPKAYVAPQSAPLEPEESSFELEDFSFDDSPTNTADGDENFDLSFDDSTTVSGEPEPDFDFNFEEQTTPTTAADDNTFDLEELSFDSLEQEGLQKDDLSFDEPVQSNNATTTNLSDDLDFGLDLGDETLATQNNELPEEDNAFALDDLSFDDLDLGQSQSLEQEQSLDKTADTANLNDFEQEFSFDGLELGGIEEKETDSLDTSFALEDLDFSSDSKISSVEPSVAEATKESSTQALFADEPSVEASIEDFNQATIEQSTTVFDDNLLLDDIALDKDTALFDDSHGIEESPAPSVSEPAPVPISELALGTNTDTPAITLELAQQYLNLGEQDSAKRLLQEVSQSGSSEQQQKAQSLLAKL